MRTPGPIWRQVTAYGGLFAAGTLALQWLDYRRLARSQIDELALALIAGGFLVLGIVVGVRAFAPRAAVSFDGNPQAIESLGITRRELAVLRELAAGRSNKEIAVRLAVSPNTIKTHVARLYEKLGAVRRTDALTRARALGILP
nr:helix-turn-helix transcriptional regulator [Sphingomonas sp. Y57]